jgi:hypothetical protein
VGGKPPAIGPQPQILRGKSAAALCRPEMLSANWHVGRKRSEAQIDSNARKDDDDKSDYEKLR